MHLSFSKFQNKQPQYQIRFNLKLLSNYIHLLQYFGTALVITQVQSIQYSNYAYLPQDFKVVLVISEYFQTFLELLKDRRIIKSFDTILLIQEYQVGEYVFTTTGWHVPKPKDISNDFTSIIAHPQSPRRFQTTVESLEKERIVTHRPSLSLSLRLREKELSMETAEVQRYLIIGITFLTLPDAIGKNCPTVKKRGVVGTKAEDGNKVDLDGSIAPYLVVTPELSDDGKGGSSRTNLHALIVEKSAPDGLCLPTIVSQSKIFYFARYRDGSTTRDGRAAGWNQLVAKEAARNAPPTPLWTKQMRYRKRRDTTKVVLDPAISLNNSIGYHINSYLRTSETWHLQKVLTLMEEADEDLKHMPAPSNKALMAFLDNENEDFGEDDAETMDKEMAEL
ncbi:hypothetical protein BHYA_0120g00080 [Botrytis hyacinthi]|uniref:Uncharacterized protein n=1 Tax=Botrytis hyacinthi TaxID=278943 RepID=A0A4Z1GI39_9HELO|nr:hypothetical protein BHYA_0120g00080 [Botrytis hyacinthi]